MGRHKIRDGYTYERVGYEGDGPCPVVFACETYFIMLWKGEEHYFKLNETGYALENFYSLYRRIN